MTIETEKNDCSVEPFSTDWTDVYQQLGLTLATNPIVSSIWTAVGLTVDSDSFTDLLATAVISGGAIGTPATLENKITITGVPYELCQKYSITIE